MKTMILTTLAALMALAPLTTTLADPPIGREREWEKQREVEPDRSRSPYERGRYSDPADGFDFEGGRWGRDVRFNDETPSFFPDGRRVAFSSNRDGRDRELYCRDTTRNGPLIRLTQNDADDWAPSVSPDGRWIAFLSNRDGRTGLFAMRSDGRDVRCLVRGGRQSLASPTWSPDGRWVAFTSRQGGGSALLRVRADGGNGRVERLGGTSDERTLYDL